MEEFNLEEIDKRFYVGKRYLDAGRYQHAIDVYDKLVKENYKFLGDEEADILIETSLNNRGCAKCRLGLETKNKELFQSGLDDYKSSVAIDKRQSEEEKKWLTAFNNLKYGEEQLKEFGNDALNVPNSNFKSV